MQSSDEQMPRSPGMCNLESISYEEFDQQYLGTTNHEILTDTTMQLSAQIKNQNIDLLLRRIERLEERLAFLEAKEIQTPSKKKKNRRKAKQIPRVYKCMVSDCGKEYGSETSLKNHRKIKHGIRMIRKMKTAKTQASPIVPEQC